MTQLSLDLATVPAPRTVRIRWAVASPTWPAPADTPCVRGAFADDVRRETRPAGRVVRLGDLAVGEHAWIDRGTHWALVARDDRPEDA